MHSPQLIIIEARRKALGDAHPDFSGPAGLVEVKKAAHAPPEPAETAPDQPEPPDQADLEHGAARIAAELRQIADRTCELSEELATMAGAGAASEGSGDSEEGEGASGELEAREPGAKD